MKENRKRRKRNTRDVFGKIWWGQRSACSPGTMLPALKKRGREYALFLVLESETHKPRVSLCSIAG